MVIYFHIEGASEYNHPIVNAHRLVGYECRYTYKGEVRSDAESSPQRVAHNSDNVASPTNIIKYQKADWLVGLKERRTPAALRWNFAKIDEFA